LQCLVEKFSEELQKDFIELVYNSARKGDLKISPVNVLWVVSSRNGTGNNSTHGKLVGKNGTFFQHWGGGLEFEKGV